MTDLSGDNVLWADEQTLGEKAVLAGFCSVGHQLVLEPEEEERGVFGGVQVASKRLNYRQRYEQELRELKSKYADLEPEFSDDDMNAALPEEDRKRGWHYPLTKTQQKKEYGCVIAEQQRFLLRLKDGHLDIVEDYLLNPKKKKAIDVNRYDDEGWTPLHHAARKNYREIVRALLEGDADPGLRDKVNGLSVVDVARMGVDDLSGPNDEVLEVLKDFGVRR